MRGTECVKKHQLALKYSLFAKSRNSQDWKWKLKLKLIEKKYLNITMKYFLNKYSLVMRHWPEKANKYDEIYVAILNLKEKMIFFCERNVFVS